MRQRNCFLDNSDDLAWTSCAVPAIAAVARRSLGFLILDRDRRCSNDASNEENHRRRIEQLAPAAIPTTYKCVVEAVLMDVCDCFKTPVDPVRVRDEEALLQSLATSVNDAYSHLTRGNSKGPLKDEETISVIIKVLSKEKRRKFRMAMFHFFEEA